MTQTENLSMNYDDGNLPRNTRAAETIPDELPGRNRPKSGGANGIPDELPGRSAPESTNPGGIPLEIPQHGCPGPDFTHGQEVVL